MNELIMLSTLLLSARNNNESYLKWKDLINNTRLDDILIQCIKTK